MLQSFEDVKTRPYCCPLSALETFLEIEYLSPPLQGCWNIHAWLGTTLRTWQVTWMCVWDFWYSFKLIPFQRALLCWVDIGFKATRAWFATCDVKGIFTIFGCIPLFHLRLFDLFFGCFSLTSSHSKAYKLKNIGPVSSLILLLCKVLDLE